MSDINTRALLALSGVGGPMDRGLCRRARRDLAAAALASYVPARRAATIDPMLTMKVE